MITAISIHEIKILRFLTSTSLVEHATGKKAQELQKNGVGPSQRNRKVDFRQKTYVCLHVFENTRPVLLVTRPEGDWCFLCGENHDNDASAYRVVGIGHIFDRDASLLNVLDLEPNWDAERTSVG